MSAKFERLIILLNDNAWHNPKEIAETLEIPQNKLQRIIQFLAESDLIQQDTTTNQIKLNKNWKTFILNQENKDEDIEGASDLEAVGTIIIPPKQIIKIQSTRIANLTDSSLELEIRVNKRVADIAISKLK